MRSTDRGEMFPIIDVAGGPHERGLQYGEQARPQIERCLADYRRVFQHYATLEWEQVRDLAEGFVDPIREFGERYLRELEGIAEGAGVDFLDIVSLNLRTEVMFAAKAARPDATLPRVGECSAYAAIAPTGAVLAGQNWDWLPHARESVVVLRARQDDGPDYVTVVEAGLLAKFGLNSEGLAVLTNALVSSEDRGEPGVPYHVMLRALLDCSTPSQALGRIRSHQRASSANYLVVHRDGVGFDVEALPGGFTEAHVLDPDDRGVLMHTNHFTAPGFAAVDVGDQLMTDSRLRLQRVRRQARIGDPHDPATLRAALGDHAGYPHSVCCHPDPADHELEQDLTVTSVVIDVSAATLSLSAGPPCTGYHDLPTGFGG